MLFSVLRSEGQQVNMLNISCSANKKASHYAFIDYLRGIALLLMFVYHFCFDLNYYQFIQTNFYNNPLWIYFRVIIVSLFLWLVGISLWLAASKEINLPRYLTRLIFLAISALLVSASSYITFPSSYIYFGILHFILLASIVGLAFVRLYYANLILGIALIFIGIFISHSVFNHNNLQWFGLMTYKPKTEDYVPFLPWFGVVLLGIFSAQFIFKKGHFKIFKYWQDTSRHQQLIVCMGRHSLLIYLLHQPVFMGILFIFSLMLT